MARITWLIVLIFSLFLASENVLAQSFFRHHGGVAIDDSAALPGRFDENDKVLWKQDLLPGHSTPCLFGDFLFVTTSDQTERELATVALHQDTGKILWSRVVKPNVIEPYHTDGSPAASSVACDGQRVYAFFGSYGLLCYDMQGELIWSKQMGPFQDEFGAASSPILADGKVILNEDHDMDSFLIAIDQQTGETVWKVDRSEFTRSYATPAFLSHDGKNEIVVAGAVELIAYDIIDGRKSWWVTGLSRLVDSTPVVNDGHLYLATWSMGGDQEDRLSMKSFTEALKEYDQDGNGRIAKSELRKGPVLRRFFRIDTSGDQELDQQEWKRQARVFELAQNVAMAVEPGGSGDVTNTHVKWIYRRGLPVVPSPLVYQNVFYMIKNGGILTSLDAETGTLIKQGRVGQGGNYFASLVAGDGKVYVASDRGEVTVVKAEGQWEIVSSHDFGARIMATPAIGNGKIFIRTDDAVHCFVAKN